MSDDWHAPRPWGLRIAALLLVILAHGLVAAALLRQSEPPAGAVLTTVQVYFVEPASGQAPLADEAVDPGEAVVRHEPIAADVQSPLPPEIPSEVAPAPPQVPQAPTLPELPPEPTSQATARAQPEPAPPLEATPEPAAPTAPAEPVRETAARPTASLTPRSDSAQPDAVAPPSSRTVTDEGAPVPGESRVAAETSGPSAAEAVAAQRPLAASERPRWIQHVEYLGRPPMPDYPRASQRRQEQGRVVVRVWITAEGRVREASVWRSSGHERLDQAAVRAAQRARFRPYTESGVAQAALADLPFDFVL